MTRRLALGAAALAALAAAPAHAAVYPACATALTLAAAGATASCPTDNTPMMAGAVVQRTVRVAVQSGVVEATLTCGYGSTAPTRTIVVSGPKPQAVSLYEDWSQSCRVTLKALYDDTTAVATSTFSYAFIGPVWP